MPFPHYNDKWLFNKTGARKHFPWTHSFFIILTAAANLRLTQEIGFRLCWLSNHQIVFAFYNYITSSSDQKPLLKSDCQELPQNHN
jgi:hypothetical protein